MKTIDRQAARNIAARSYCTTDLGLNLSRFVEQGIVNDHQKRALKGAGYIDYSIRGWNLTDAGKAEAVRLGYLPGDDYVGFGDIARGQIGMQCQYASRYVHGVGDYPNLGVGLRFTGTNADYHSMKIHKDDVAEFVRRMKEHRSSMGG